MSNNYKGYSLFNDVEDAALRTWNRCVVLCNINHTHSEGFVEGYSASMSKVDKMQMMAMLHYIKARGAEEVRKEINQGQHSIVSEA